MSALVLAMVLTQAPHQLRWEPAVDITFTSAATVGWLVSEFVVKRQLAPPGCRWCQTNALDTMVRSWFNPTLAPSADGIAAPDLVSNALGFVTVPTSRWAWTRCSPGGRGRSRARTGRTSRAF